MTTELNAMQARAALVRERLPEHLDRLGWSTERIAAHQRDALRRFAPRSTIRRSTRRGCMA